MIEYEIEDEDGDARAGTMEVNGRSAETPLFMPVGTAASVKTLISEDLEELGVDAVITNMYHLLMRPGIELVEDGGGLHDFMNFDGVIFTDSGGFQMIRKGFDKDLDADRVKFKSDHDGTVFEITPEKAIDMQKRLDSDVMMCLDHCPPYPAQEGEVREATERTTKWARKCSEEGGDIFGISQGGVTPQLRRKSCEDMVEIGFQGYALGGLSIGEPREDMYHMIDIADDVYPDDRPRYLMGLGSPVEMLEAVERGVDIFDSAYPTRNARHRTVFTSHGTIDIRKSRFKEDRRPLEEGCDCPICSEYTRAYINHLCRADELAWMRMTTVHNLHFILELMRGAREAIKSGSFEQFKSDFVKNYE